MTRADTGDESVEELSRFFSDLGTNLWRLRRKMLDPQTGAPRKEMRVAHTYVERAFKDLEGVKVEVRDHDNAQFDSGLALKVLDFQEVSGIEQETVIDTIKPSIFYRGEMIQMGEVIVGTPKASGGAAREGGGRTA